MNPHVCCDSVSAPAHPPAPWRRLFGVTGVMRRLRRYNQLWRERRQLQALPDELLRDVGLSREQVRRESRRHYWDDLGWRR
ncbi:DUF1127 domain-containing protein [Billgrantia pellis]|uniref:DUF1127 domain-containing protein n=1 Tax=Billgrantia pellis TaxID=2606936 RepID=A0A7V7KIG3_9GAMM|nr:DUF1127 domain-containing protein [Halomonas pellis]KAA0012650.1 DUF1127 domain-containing protein [Halomonas pellis]